MKRPLVIFLLPLLASCVVPLHAEPASTVSGASANGAASTTSATTRSNRHRVIDPDDAYKNNCMRCHTALPQYSQRMNKTILMHMRVDGNIPGDEAEALLDYLNGGSE